MPLTQCRPLVKTLNMQLFATGVTGNLRVVLTRLSSHGANGQTESFFLGFFEEDEPTNSSYAEHIEVAAALARSIVGNGSPITNQENEETLDVVLMSPPVLAIVRQLAPTYPLLVNITGQIDALNTQTELGKSTPHAQQKRQSSSWGKPGGAI
jgi:hypothetical protein